jgi:hypothetical protein
MAKKREQSKAQLRNLSQYRDMTDEDFEDMWNEDQQDISLSKGFQERIDKKIFEFSQDYDIDDLKINDKETLRAFVQAIIALEDYERFIYNIRSDVDISASNINVVDRISKIMSDLRKDISRFQEDLNITRKIRKSDKESSVVNYITSLKDSARQYYESKMSYIYCPKCNMLLGNVWSLYPDANNKLTFECLRPLDNAGTLCGNKFTVTTAELLKNRGTNKPDIIPDSML